MFIAGKLKSHVAARPQIMLGASLANRAKNFLRTARPPTASSTVAITILAAHSTGSQPDPPNLGRGQRPALTG